MLLQGGLQAKPSFLAQVKVEVGGDYSEHPGSRIAAGKQ